jgi:hypothetical protein
MSGRISFKRFDKTFDAILYFFLREKRGLDLDNWSFSGVHGVI